MQLWKIENTKHGAFRSLFLVGPKEVFTVQLPVCATLWVKVMQSESLHSHAQIAAWLQAQSRPSKHVGSLRRFKIFKWQNTSENLFQALKHYSCKCLLYLGVRNVGRKRTHNRSSKDKAKMLKIITFQTIKSHTPKGGSHTTP